MRIYHTIPLVGICLLAASCGEKEFKVKGNIQGLADTKLALEKADGAGSWQFIDSLKVGSSGSFSASVPSPAAPEIYRLVYEGKYIYFPVDSVETITIDARGKEFGRDYTLSGTPGAVSMSRFDSLLNTLPANPDAVTMEAFKRRVYTEFLAPAQGNLTSYYILTKTRDGKPIYDTGNVADTKYFGAVATSYEHYRPDDPRTALLRDIATAAMRNAAKSKGRQKVIEAPEITSFEIAMPGTDGNIRRLSDHLGKGRPVLLVFTALGASQAPAYNAEIKKIYDSGRADVFMVGLDADRYIWREAAANLPWTNVYNADGESSKTLIEYNVTAVPTTFIFNAAGELVDRADDASQIAARL